MHSQVTHTTSGIVFDEMRVITPADAEVITVSVGISTKDARTI
jgi:hypothetical protein